MAAQIDIKITMTSSSGKSVDVSINFAENKLIIDSLTDAVELTRFQRGTLLKLITSICDTITDVSK